MSSDRYQVKEKIGEGGAGSVYLALDTRLDRLVAIKRLFREEDGDWDQESVDGMLREARLLSTLEHPNIVTIYDADVDKDGPYVVMELLQGDDMDALMAKNAMTGKDFRHFATQCLEALSAAHSKNIIHRDIKPNNIVLKWLPNGKFQAKLLDFGMAKLSSVPSKQTVDHASSVMGSIYFMAPEQFERIELDGRTDIYALGAVFYYTLTGSYPFTGDTAATIMAAHLTHRVQPIIELRPDLPQWTCDFVMWMINREASDRPNDAQTALELFIENDEKVPLSTFDSFSSQEQTSEPKIAKPTLLSNSGNFKIPSITASTTLQSIKETTEVKVPSNIESINTATSSVKPSTKTEVTSQSTHEKDSSSNDQESTETSDNQSSISLKPLFISLGAVIPIVIFILLLFLSKHREVQRYNDLVNQVTPNQKDLIETSKKDFNFLKERLVENNPKFNSQQIVSRISFAKDDNSYNLLDTMVEVATSEESDTVPDETRRIIFQDIISQKKDKGLLEKLTPFIKSYESDATVIHAIKSTKNSATDKDITNLAGFILNFESREKKHAAADIVSYVISNSSNKVQISELLQSKLSKTTDILSRSILTKLVASTGDPNAQKLIISGLESGTPELIATAISALKEWPTGELTKSAIDFLAQTTGKSERSRAMGTVITLLKKHHIKGNDLNIQLWNQAADHANTSNLKHLLINGVTSSKFEKRRNIIQKFLNDGDKTVSDRAKKADHYISSEN